MHAHGLRHTHAAELRAEGVDVAIIRRQLGHANLMTTIGYLDHLGGASVVEVIAKRQGPFKVNKDLASTHQCRPEMM